MNKTQKNKAFQSCCGSGRSGTHAGMYIKMSTELKGCVFRETKRREQKRSERHLPQIRIWSGSRGSHVDPPPTVKDGWRWVGTHSAAVFEVLCVCLTVCKHKRVCVCVREVAGERFSVGFAKMVSRQRNWRLRHLDVLFIASIVEHKNPQDRVSERPPLRTKIFCLFVLRLPWRLRF